MKNAPALAAAGRLKTHHLGAWTALCTQYGTWERLARKLSRLAVTNEEFNSTANATRQCEARYQMACLRFGLDPAADGRLTTLDGSDVDGARPASAAPASSTEEDPGETWLREYGDRG